MLKAILREPLVHFLLLGAALFALEGFALNRLEYELYRRAGELAVSGE